MSVYTMLPVKLSRSRIILLFLLVCMLSACMDGGPTAKTPQTMGPIQLYDMHGKLICQIHGQNPQFDCLEKNVVQSQLASYFIDYALSQLASDLHVSRENRKHARIFYTVQVAP